MTDVRDPEPDRDVEIHRRFDERVAEALRGLVTAELLEEHRRDPTGDHSPALARVLVLLRSAPTRGKLALLGDPRTQRWRVVTLSGEAGRAHHIDDDSYASEREALHEVLLRRLESIGIPVRGDK